MKIKDILKKIYYINQNQSKKNLIIIEKSIPIICSKIHLNAKTFLFLSKFTNMDFQTDFYSDFNILYRNEDDWIFAGLK